MKVLKIILFVLFSYSGFCASFLEGTVDIQEKPLNWQRLYIYSQLKKVELDYIQWINSCSESEFKSHLQFSHFGGLLYDHLDKHGEKAEEFHFSEIKKKYIELLKPEFEKMRTHLRYFYRPQNFQINIYEIAAWYAGAYKNLLIPSEPMTENFHAGEQYLIQQMFALEPMLQETVKILLFIEFQLFNK